MGFEQAMAWIKGAGRTERRVHRPGLPGRGVTVRVSHPANPLAGGSHVVLMTGERTSISYTPTRDDMLALDWTVYRGH